MKRLLAALGSVFAMATMSLANASIINFDDQGLTGPCCFPSTTAETLNLTIDGVDVTITGGAILAGTANLPGNTSATYGTADFLSGGLNPITITFSTSITNFFLDVFNGNTVDVDYVVSDNAGNSAMFNLADNFSGGFETIGFAATGTVITILAMTPPQGACCAFDFFIDNIRFNEALPPDLGGEVPIPGALLLFGTGAAAFGAVRRKRQAAA